MARNVEIKARLTDPAGVALRVAAIADAAPEELVQRDTFFLARRGRLKLRIHGNGSAELIYYERPDHRGPTASTYSRLEVADPEALLATLAAALGVRARVAKRRALSKVGRTRIHLDEVEGLGHFLELEVVLAPGEAIDAGVEEAYRLLEELSIEADDLVDAAYVDLLEALSESPTDPA